MKRRLFAIVTITLSVMAAVMAETPAETSGDVSDIDRQIQELQSKKVEALRNKALRLEEQAAEQKKKQMELEEKEKSLNDALSQAAKENEKSKGQKASAAAPIGRVVYVEAPVVVTAPASAAKTTSGKKLTGTEAVLKTVSDITVPPSYEDGELRAFVYRRQALYQVHCQTYHTTMIQLEPGESLLEVPYISESEVWKLSRGTGLTDGKAVQYLMLKPDKKGLDSSMIIITDRRVYQMQIKSYDDHYMPTVRWVYNDRSPDSGQWGDIMDAASTLAAAAAPSAAVPTEFEDILGSMADTLSFNYEIKTTSRTVPSWLPVAVYDNGQSTYIILPRTVLNMEMPSLFENTKDIINKNVKKNVIVINKLTKKMTMKLGQEKVVIKKL